jgi:F-type H+-transporting ATPase subunit delta
MATNRLIEKSKVGVYANTLFDAANETGGQDGVVTLRNELQGLIRVINGDLNLSTALSNPDYSPEERATIARNIFATYSEPLCEVLAVMSQNQDIDLINRVFHSFEDVMAEKLNLCVCDVKTVVPLDDSLRNLIQEKIEADLGCKAVLNESIDKSILGGIVMSINGKHIDASVISQLNKARQVLKETDGGEN